MPFLSKDAILFQKYMASKQKKASVLSGSTFADCLFKIAYRFSLQQVFGDFLEMSIAACTQNLQTKKSWYEDEYLSIIAKYKDSELRHEFPKAFAALVAEMDGRLSDSQGNDALGEFFEQHISNGRNGQYFTPFHICMFMASISNPAGNSEMGEPLRILDPACGSGRMLLAAHRIKRAGTSEYYGIDIDRTCVQMTALNLFLHGMWNSEVMCANALSPGDFVTGYRISMLPLGIFKIESKEQSKLWHLHQQSFTQKENGKGHLITLDNLPFNEREKDNSAQLDLF